MNTNIEELKFVTDLAHNGGVMQAQNDALKAEVERLKAEIDNQKEMNLKKDDIIAAQNQRIAELLAMLHQQDSQPKVVVHNFFLLSCHKTVSYVNGLDNDGRRFVAHFMHHTMPADTPMSVIAEVDKITTLEGDKKGRLADALEEIAKKPTTQNNYGETVIPNVENFQPQIGTQNIDMPKPSAGQQDQKQLEDE